MPQGTSAASPEPGPPFLPMLSGEGGARGGPGDRHKAPPGELRVRSAHHLGSRLGVITQQLYSVPRTCLSAGCAEEPASLSFWAWSHCQWSNELTRERQAQFL